MDGGKVSLPRFQRAEVWKKDNIERFLTSIVRGYPTGALLLLEKSPDKSPFVTRQIKGSDTKIRDDAPYLLDGQQRLTALWKGLTNRYADTRFICFTEIENGQPQLRVKGYAVSRSAAVATFDDYGDADGDTETSPVPKLNWWDNKRAAWQDGARGEDNTSRAFPLSLLNPVLDRSSIESWAAEACDTAQDTKECVEEIVALADSTAELMMPALVMGAATTRDQAIAVFIDSNTSAVKIDNYDLLRAAYEGELRRDLDRDLAPAVDDLKSRLDPYGKRSQNLELLYVLCLMQGKVPVKASFPSLECATLRQSIPHAKRGLEAVLEILTEMKAHTSAYLPERRALYVAAAIKATSPGTDKNWGHVDPIITKYLWRAFFTDRYGDGPSQKKPLEDFVGIRSLLEGTGWYEDVPVFNPNKHKPIIKEQALDTRYNKTDRISKAVLLAISQCGANNLVDSSPLSATNSLTRKQFFVFTPAYLTDNNVLHETLQQTPLNVLMLTASKPVGSDECQPPLQYLEVACNLSQPSQRAQMEDDLDTHLIPVSVLANKRPGEDTRAWYQRFLDQRWDRIEDEMHMHCDMEDMPDLQSKTLVG